MALTELNNARLVKIGPDNIPQAQSLLCDAYRNNAFTRYMFNAEKSGYEQRLRGFIHEELLLHFSLSNISLAIALEDRLIGVAMVSRADLPLSMATNWRWRMGMYSLVGIRYTERLRSYYKAVQESLKDKKHYWISLMGLHHDFQHHGFGHMLIEGVHQECEKESNYCGISVDSVDAQYKSFFQSLGYRKEAAFSVGPLTMDVLLHPRGEPLKPSPAREKAAAQAE
jgi:GNAT superfamily N-acetyltransferase